MGENQACETFCSEKRQGYRYYQENRSSWAYILIHKSYYEIVDKIIY